MIISSNSSRYKMRKNVLKNVPLLFLFIYLFTGIQSNLNFDILGYYCNVNILFIVVTFLVIEFKWQDVSGYCILIGLIFDTFTDSQFGLGTIAVYLMGYIISRIKKAFYVEYMSTAVFLLFLLIIGYSLIFTLWNFIAQRIPDFLVYFTQMVIDNTPLTILAVPLIYPLLKVFFHGKNI